MSVPKVIQVVSDNSIPGDKSRMEQVFRTGIVGGFLFRNGGKGKKETAGTSRGDSGGRVVVRRSG